jgi:hypothetical protein
MATTMASIVILEKWNTVLEDKAHHALKTALQYTELAYATILGEKVSIDGLIETYSQPGFDYYKDLGTLSFDLQKRINRFSYEKEQ